MFRAATYYRSADFYLHGNPNDPRINEYWYAQASAHDVAISLLPVPGKRINITTTSGFYVPAIYYKAPNCKGPRPTFIIGSGYDGQQEELYHQMVFPVLERGWNVITYEGPGQATPRRFQNLGFILEWEKVVTPVVDYLLSDKHQEVDAQAIALVGFSFGGFLAPRAAAFEHRLAALVAIDGVYDFGKTFNWGPITPYLGSGNETAFNAGIQYIHKTSNDTKIRWGIDQGLWAWNTESSYEWATAIKNFTLEGIVKNIKCPTFVGDAENDIFFTGQPQELADNLGSLATRHVFKTEDGEGEHCQLGAFRGLNQVVLDWFRGTVLDKVGK